MEWKIEYVEVHNYVRITAKGLFSIHNHLNFLEDIVSRKFWKPGMPILFDNRNVDFGKLDLNQVMQASSNYQLIAEKFGGSKGAMLMKSISDFGTGRQFEILSENKGSVEMHVFHDENEALEWLLN